MAQRAGAVDAPGQQLAGKGWAGLRIRRRAMRRSAIWGTVVKSGIACDVYELCWCASLQRSTWSNIFAVHTCGQSVWQLLTSFLGLNLSTFRLGNDGDSSQS